VSRGRPLGSQLSILHLIFVGPGVPLVEEVYFRSASLRIVLHWVLGVVKIAIVQVLRLVGLLLSTWGALPLVVLLEFNGQLTDLLLNISSAPIGIQIVQLAFDFRLEPILLKGGAARSQAWSS
jgi:hypothetical protein